jgi:DNA-binding MarR family transcriptional regulator
MVTVSLASRNTGVSVDPSRRRPKTENARTRRAAAGRTAKPGKPVRRFRLGPLTGYLDYALRQAQLAVFANSVALLSRFELKPAEFGVLIVIDHNPGLRATDVCKALGLQKANFAPLVRSLERRGLVQRRSSALDRRTRALQLTVAGTRRLARARKLHERHQRSLTAGLGAAATRRLISQLLALAAWRGAKAVDRSAR